MKIFSDATRHTMKWHTKPGAIARKAVGWLGLAMLRRGRKLLAWIGGRCSWCGADPGFQSAVSRKGLRCMGYDRDCTKYPAA